MSGSHSLDVTLAGSLSRLVITREAPATVREGEAGRSTLTIENPTRRHVRGAVRDAWVPSAGATGEPTTLTTLGLVASSSL